MVASRGREEFARLHDEPSVRLYKGKEYGISTVGGQQPIVERCPATRPLPFRIHLPKCV